jgi:uncharacterized protein YeaO (DUF488 family)
MIYLKRDYDRSEPTDGDRFLVERLWPRGMRKATLHMTLWLKEVAPSDTLRRWFGHDPAKWEDFQHRYFIELDSKPEAWRPIVEATHGGNVTLLYSARDTTHNNAVALKRYLEQHLEKGSDLTVTGCRGSARASSSPSAKAEHRATPHPASGEAKVSVVTSSLSLAGRLVLVVLTLLFVWLGVYPAPFIDMIQAIAARLI